MEHEAILGRPRLYDPTAPRKAVQLRNGDTISLLAQCVARKTLATGRSPVRESEVIHDALTMLLASYDEAQVA